LKQTQNAKNQKHLIQIKTYLNEENFDKAKELLDLLSRSDKENMELHFLYGIYYAKKKIYRSAISYLLRVLDSSHSSIYLPQAVKILVYCYAKTENYQLAVSIAEDSLSKYYEDVNLKNILAYIQYMQGNISGALKIYQDVLKKDPENPTALNGIGYCLIDNYSRYQEGVKFCSKALKNSPHDASVLDSIGWGYYKLGEYKKAEGYLKQAFEILPDDPTIKKHITLAVEAS